MIGRAMLCWPASTRLLSASVPTTAPKSTLVLSIRTYATPGRPKSVVGEPTRPVKRAVKRDARKPADGKSAAEKKVASKRKIKLTDEQKALREEKLKAARAAMKVRQEKAKELAKKREEKEKLVELKKAALDIKRPKVIGAYTTFTSEKIRGQSVSHRNGTGGHQGLGDLMKQVAAEWTTLGPAEKEHYNVLARQNREAAEAAYKAVVEKYTPDEIRAANVARKQLNSKFPTAHRKKPKYPEIIDERVVAKPVSAYIHFVTNRHASGDLKGIEVGDRLRLVAQEWNALNAEEKSKYNDLAKKDADRFAEQYKETYGHEYVPRKVPAKTAAAAAA